MKFKTENANGKSKAPISSIIMYIFAAISAIIVVVSLVNSIVLFNKTVAYYVTQGSTASEVSKQLISSQLLPAIFESVIAYGGIALILVGAGIINHKVSKCLTMLSNTEISHDIVEDTILEEPANDDATAKDEDKEEVTE